jgi:hypothetical protein
MVTVTEHGTMAKRMGRPKSDRDDVTVKVDRRLVVQARTVAGFRGLSVADLLSRLLEEPLRQAYAEMVRDMPPTGPPKKGGKPA